MDETVEAIAVGPVAPVLVEKLRHGRQDNLRSFLGVGGSGECGVKMGEGRALVTGCDCVHTEQHPPTPNTQRVQRVDYYTMLQ